MHLRHRRSAAVALGVVVTLFLQSILCRWSGSQLPVCRSRVPDRGDVHSVGRAKIGPGPILIAAVIFVYSRSGRPVGYGLLVWAIFFCVAFDNVVRPMLIKRGPICHCSDLCRVIGGVIAFRRIGIVHRAGGARRAYTLLIEWMSENEGAPQNRPAGP